MISSTAADPNTIDTWIKGSLNFRWRRKPKLSDKPDTTETQTKQERSTGRNSLLTWLFCQQRTRTTPVIRSQYVPKRIRKLQWVHNFSSEHMKEQASHKIVK